MTVAMDWDIDDAVSCRSCLGAAPLRDGGTTKGKARLAGLAATTGPEQEQHSKTQNFKHYVLLSEIPSNIFHLSLTKQQHTETADEKQFDVPTSSVPDINCLLTTDLGEVMYE